MIYLDNAATTQLDPRVKLAMEPWWVERCGNPSSPHGWGVEAAEAVEVARRRVAALAGPGGWEVIFSSGGTESNALAILGAIGGSKRRKVVTTSFEHPSVLNNAARLEDRGVQVTRIRPGTDGLIHRDALSAALDHDTALTSIMHGNNEIGTLQPIAELVTTIRALAPETLVHVDAVQTAGKVPLADDLHDVDLVTLSAHKMHGPMGVGALLVRRGSRRPAPLYGGGHQQGGIRPGTENVPGIVGFGEASRLVSSQQQNWQVPAEMLTTEFIDGLGDEPGCSRGFGDVPRVHGHEIVLLTSVPAEPVVHAMYQLGFIISSGSACQSHSTNRSHVLDAVGLDPNLDAVRIVASRMTGPGQMKQAGIALASSVRRIKAT